MPAGSDPPRDELDSIFAVVLAGGSGTRFWPASRSARPKQFLPIAGERPLIARTVERLAGLVKPERVLVVTAAEQVELVREALPELAAENVVAEPRARNTAPAVLLGALAVQERQERSLQLVLPADHAIEPEEAFRRTARAAAEEAASSKALVTFGIRPTFAATGYGYIESGPPTGERRGMAVHAVQRFVEKPERSDAERFLAKGRFLWNSGMFVWTSEAILAAYRRHLPQMLEALERARADPRGLAEAYERLPGLSVDVGILERAEDVRVLPVDFRWSDVGSWSALADVLPADAAGNVAALAGGASLTAEDTRDCTVFAEGDEVVALLGVEGLVVVRSGDATLVCPRDRAQDVRRIVERLRAEGGRRT